MLCLSTYQITPKTQILYRHHTLGTMTLALISPFLKKIKCTAHST